MRTVRSRTAFSRDGWGKYESDPELYSLESVEGGFPVVQSLVTQHLAALATTASKAAPRSHETPKGGSHTATAKDTQIPDRLHP